MPDRSHEELDAPASEPVTAGDEMPRRCFRCGQPKPRDGYSACAACASAAADELTALWDGEHYLPQTSASDVAVAQWIAAEFHASYENQAPLFGYETRRASAVPWAEVPEQNRNLMTCVVLSLIAQGVIAPGTTAARSHPPEASCLPDRVHVPGPDGVCIFCDRPIPTPSEGPET